MGLGSNGICVPGIGTGIETLGTGNAWNCDKFGLDSSGKNL